MKMYNPKIPDVFLIHRGGFASFGYLNGKRTSIVSTNIVLKPYDAFMTTDFHHRVMLSLLPLSSLSSLSLFTIIIISIIIITIVIVDKYVHKGGGYKTFSCVYYDSRLWALLRTFVALMLVWCHRSLTVVVPVRHACDKRSQELRL